MAAKTKHIELDINLHCQIDRNPISDHADPEDFVLTVNGEIYGSPDPTADISKNLQDVLLGKLNFFVIQVGNAVNHHEELAYVCDAYHQTMEAGSAVFDLVNNGFHPHVQEMFPDACDVDDILLLDHLTIHPLARGQRLGLAVLRQVIEDWSKGCSLVVIKPFPLQFEAEAQKSEKWTQLELGKFSSSEKIAFGKLRNYYQRLGFSRIGRTEFYALPTYDPFPTAKQLHISDSIHVPVEHL